MKTSKIFRCLLTLLVFWGVTVCAVAQETRRVLFGLGTADGKNLVFNTLSGSKPHGVSVRASNFNSGEFYSSVTQTEPGWFVKVGETGTISFENFNYEIKSVGIRRNINRRDLSDTELNVSIKSVKGISPDDVFDSKVDWSEPECTNIPLQKNRTSISLDGIKQIDVTVPSSHGLTINRNTFVREVSIEYVLPEIRIRFANGNKGYDVTVGDNNAQIEGYISGHAGAFVVGSDNVYFKYTSSNSSIAEISSTGRITAKAEGDTQITATLIQKVGNTEYEIASYDYPLHVFAPFEGLSWNSYDTWYKNSTSNNSSYKFGGAPHVNGIDWTISDKLKSQTTIWENESNTQSSGQYKQFASFEAPAPTTKYWRAAVQKLSCDILVPKYTKVESTMKFGANATLGSESKRDVTYGYELVDLGIKTDANTTFAAASAAATTRIGEITWNTASTKETESSVSAYRTSDRGNGITYLRNGASEYRKYNIFTGWNNGEGYVGDHYTAGAYWKYDNSKNAEPYNETRFFAAMVFLQNQENYSATASFGYQDIPTYEYYVYLDYYANYDDNKHLGREERSVKAKDATIHLNSGNVSFVPNRTGYKLLGWSTDKDAKTAEFPVNGDFYPYDSENGGGKGEVKLYAVWQPNTYTVTLNQAGGSGGTTSVTATFDEPLPSGDDVKAPIRYGYTFGGYFTGQNGAGTMYYDNSMTGIKNWDIAANTNLYAKWTANVCKVELRPNGTGAVAGTPYVMVTHGQKFPEEVDGHAVTPPTRKGYIFNGFYRLDSGNKKYFYDKDMKTLSCATWPYKADSYVLADWIPKTTIVTYDVQGGYDWAATTQPVTFGEPMPYVNTPQRQGYTFAGYYDQPNGQGKKYYDSNWGNAVSATSWDKDVEEATLYAFWEAKSQKVEFHYNNETPEKVVTVDGYKENSPNNSSLRSTTPAVPTPTKDGYIFGGWVDAVINGYLVYDSDGEATEGMYWQTNNGELVWKGRDGNEITRVYPFWVKETVTASVKVIRDKNYEGKDGIHRYVGITVSGVKNVSSFVGDGYITVDGIHFLSYTENGGADQVNSVYIDEAPIWHFEPKTVNGKTVYEISTTKNGKTVYLGNKLAQIDNTTGEIQYRPDGLGIQEYEAPKNRHFSIYGPGFLCLDDVNDEQYGRVLHWMENQQDQPWQFEEKGFSAQLRPIMIIPAGNAISGELNTENIFSMIKDELVPSDPNGTFPYSYNVGKDEDKDVYKGVLYVDMSTLSRVVENDNSLSNFKKAASDNCLFFMPENYTNTALGNNVVCKYGTKYESLTALKVTDQVPFFSPYTFSTGNYTASYTRKYGDNWGSLYIPFNASSNTDSGMTFYELLGADETRLAFQSVTVSVIPANKPLAFYGSGCDFTLTSSKNAVIAAGDIEEQASAPVTISEDIKDFVLNNVGTSSSAEWSFNGIRFCKCVYGKEYMGNRPEGTDQGLVYYFAGNQFKYVNKTGYVRIMPFRAYFKDPSGGSAKAFSIMAFDEYGATDITNIIDGNANGDGKIYDLLGRRVKIPLKGHVYIIDGKKQMY